jgi:DNA-binding transcriptional ArsR family regulator
VDAPHLAAVGTALGSPARAGIVGALMGGTAHTARELADHVQVTPPTASEHLGRLLDAGIVVVEAQGRHRYYRLAGPEVAHAIEALLVAVPPPPARPRVPAGLAFARSCYDHLAGELAVRLCDRLVDETGDDVDLTPEGREMLVGWGVDLPAPGANGNGRRPAVRTCLDWTQRRHHLAGAAGAALLTAFLDRGWLRRHAARRRELQLTAAGRTALAAHLGPEAAPIGVAVARAARCEAAGAGSTDHGGRDSVTYLPTST